MESFLFVCILVVLVIRWIYLRNRLDELENRLFLLERAAERTPVVHVAAPPIPRPSPAPPAPPIVERPEPVAPPPAFVPPPAAAPVPAHRTSEEWEALIGGNWVNKIGVFVAVIGIALLLNYAYTQLGAAGRVALSLGASVTMLVAGAVFERREKYRTFSYGLIGGGWAALYTTVYAMYAIPAAKVLDNAFAATVLLLAVAAGMIVHSLKYRSQTVTALAYFLAFVTLAIAEVTTFAVLMLVPLVASLLYIAYRYQWKGMALFGLLATYITCGLHKDTGSPLWQTQGLFLAYWLIFEAFDLLRPGRWLLPLNALGFLFLSAGKWTHASPDDIWQLAAGAAALYLGSTIVRAHTGRWKPAVLFNAALLATAIVLKLRHEWLPLALLIEAELYYLAGVRFRSAFLRTLAGAIFVLQTGALLADVFLVNLPQRAWEPVAALNVVVFYLNRALQTSEVWYGYAAAAMAVLVSGFEAGERWRGVVWSLMALGPFSLGWWRRLRDFRAQGYALACIGAVATSIYWPYPAISLAVASAVAYAFVHATLWSGADRFDEGERDAVRVAASCVSALGLCTLVWRLVPGEYLGIAWLALALLLLEAGLRALPDEFRVLALIVGVLARRPRDRFRSLQPPRPHLIRPRLRFRPACPQPSRWPRTRCRHLAGDSLPSGRTSRPAACLGRQSCLGGRRARPRRIRSPQPARAGSSRERSRCHTLSRHRPGIVPAHPAHRAHHRLLLGRHAPPRNRQRPPALRIPARHLAAGCADLPRSQRLGPHRRLGRGGRRPARRRLRPARPCAPPLRPRALFDLHLETLLLGPAQSGDPAAHHQLHCPRPAPGHCQLGLHALPRSGPALSVIAI